jgi:uncharacterized protein YdhG (YjbR/CyaY superfamily)
MITRKRTKAGNIDEYIASFPKDIQAILEEVRATIRKAAPDAEEAIKYAMHAFTLNGVLVYFAAHKNHIGFYPTSKGVASFEKELSKYEYSKGAIQFPIDQIIPLNLISKIVKFRVKQNLEKAKNK